MRARERGGLFKSQHWRGAAAGGSAGIEGILPSFEGGTPSIPGYSRRARDQYGETQTPDGDCRDVAGLRERMARLEGLFEGFTRRESAAG